MPHACWMRAGKQKPINVRAVFAVAVVFFAAGGEWPWPHSHAASSSPALPVARLPRAGERILVFSPHPDDETLGLGGFLHAAARRGAEVRIVFFTSGDGFPLCAAAKYRRWPGASRMRELAVDREEEARAALARLGVSRDRLTFLGYPDRGLAALWQSHWSAVGPYRSPYTGATAAPERDGGRRRLYCGTSVLDETEAVLRQFQPERVIYPDPADDHPDHWAAHCFVRLALERLAGEPWLRQSEQRTYLIHRGNWPSPLRPDRSLPLRPPAALTHLGRRWEALPLRGEDLDAKSAALRAYRSQDALAGNFLHAFLRANELLARWPEPAGSQTFPDSIQDRFLRARWGAVDFTGVQVESDPQAVKLSVRLRQSASRWPAYYLYWKPVSGNARSIRTRRYRITGYRCDPPATQFAIHGPRLQVTVPRSELRGSTRIMVAASVWSGPLLLDRTPWRVVTVTDQPERLPRARPKSGLF